MFENRAVRLEMRRHATENEEIVLFLHLKRRKNMQESISSCYMQFAKRVC